MPEAFPGESWHRDPLAEVVADKGYHKTETLRDLVQEGYRTFIPERRQRGRRRFTDKGGTKTARAVYANRARVKQSKGKELQRRRGELLEHPNQHLYDRTGLRHLPLPWLDNVRKRAILQAVAFNLGAVKRWMMCAGVPTPCG